MKLRIDTLVSLVHGAVGVENKQGSVRFCRFTEEQIAEMRAFCEEKKVWLSALYKTANDLSL